MKTVIVIIAAALLTIASAAMVQAEPSLQVNRIIQTIPFVNSTVNIEDGEGMAYVPINDSVWLADDTADKLFEVDRASGTLRSFIEKSSLAQAVEFGGTTLAGVARAADIEALAYDAEKDVLYAFSTDCCPSPATVFRLVRASPSERFQVETFQPLPSGFRPGAAFVGAAFHPTEGLYVAGGAEIRSYDYVTNVLGEPVAIDAQVVGTIFGMGFSPDGHDLWLVTSADKVYRVDWASKRLLPGYAFDLLAFGITDARAVEVIDDQLYVVDGAGTLSVTVFDIVGTSPPPPPGPDTQLPSVSITSPTSGDTVTGTVTVTARGSDNVGVTRVDYMVDGQVLAVLSPPLYSLDWASTTVANGVHTLTARAYDAAGNSAVSGPVTVTVANTAPAPVATALTPSSATAGGTDFMLTVSGSSFVASSVVQWNGSNRPTTFVSTTELRAAIAAADIAAAGTVPVTVVTPAPGGGTATLTFDITNPPPVATALSPSSTPAGGASFTLTVTGSGFVPSSVVQWDGASRSTTFVSSTQLRAEIVAGDIATAGTAQVTVVTPSPGGGTSGTSIFAMTSAEAGLIGFWAFNEGTGTQATDVSGDGHRGTLMDGPEWSAGTLAFDGVNDYVEVAHAPDLNAYPLTVGTWIKTTSATGVRGVVGKYLGGSANGWGLFLNEGRLCAWYYRSSTSYVSNSSSCPFNVAGVNDGRWHHVVFVVDLFGGRVYVDGVRKAIISWTGSAGPASTTQPLHLGRYPAAGYFPGLLDNVRIYNRALSAAEVLNLYTKESSAARP